MDVDAHRERDLLIVGEGPQRYAGAAPAEERAHSGDGRRRRRQGHQPAGGDPDAEYHERLLGNRQRDRRGEAAEEERRHPAQQRAQPQGHHDDADQGLPDEPPQHHAIEGQRERHHGGAGKGERARRPESRPMHARCRQARAKHHPLAQREVDHARGLVDHHEGERDQGIDGPGEDPVDEEGGEEEHGRLAYPMC